MNIIISPEKKTPTIPVHVSLPLVLQKSANGIGSELQHQKNHRHEQHSFCKGKSNYSWGFHSEPLFGSSIVLLKTQHAEFVKMTDSATKARRTPL